MDDELRQRLDGIEASLRNILSQLPPRVAGAAELDGERGDPEVKFPSKKWTGESFDGLPFSQTSAAFLHVHAEWLQFKANNPQQGKDPKYARYAADDAAKARGWAARLEKNPPKPRAAARPPATGYGGGGGYGGGNSGGYGAGRAQRAAAPPSGDTGFGGDDVPY